MHPVFRTASWHRDSAPWPRAWVLAAVVLMAGCGPQNVRDQMPAASAEEAARNAVLIEPGPPPPDLAAPSDAVILERLRRRAAQRRAAARLRLDDQASLYQDVWHRLRTGFRLPRVQHRSIDAELRWYASRPDYIQRTTDRARLYLAYIVREAQRRRLPLELALLPVVESAFQPYARSPAGAMGLWQFIRSTGRIYGLHQSHWYDGRRDVLASTRAAFDYLQKLHRDMDGDWLLAIASYNTGEGNVMRAIARNRARGKPTDFFSLRLPAETRAYVPRLLAISRLVATPEAFGITLDPIDDEPYFRRVDVGGQISLAKAAEMAGISLNEMMLLNPGFMRHATDPAGPHHLLVPAESEAAFRQSLAALPADERMLWATHQVSRGETLTAIARRYGVSVASLREANAVDGTALEVGQELKVPGSMDSEAMASLSPEVRAGMRRAQRNEKRRVYRVRRGDSLWSIARKHRVRVSTLMRWNGLNKRSVIRPGQRLVIWQAGSGASAATRASRKPRKPEEHVVRSGDNLWNIARRYKISTDDLARWNGIRKSDILRVGQKLRLSPPASARRIPTRAPSDRA